MILVEEIKNIGKIQKTHALKGELNMILEVDPEYFLEGNPLIVEIDGIYVPYYIETIRPKGNTSFLVKIEGVDSESEASYFINKNIYMLKKDSDEWLEEGEGESESLIGYKVYEVNSGISVGEIEDIDDSTVNLLFIVRQKNGEEVLIPANDNLIIGIDDENKTITMEIPDGLIDLNLK